MIGWEEKKPRNLANLITIGCVTTIVSTCVVDRTDPQARKLLGTAPISSEPGSLWERNPDPLNTFFHPASPHCSPIPEMATGSKRQRWGWCYEAAKKPGEDSGLCPGKGASEVNQGREQSRLQQANNISLDLSGDLGGLHHLQSGTNRYKFVAYSMIQNENRERGFLIFYSSKGNVKSVRAKSCFQNASNPFMRGHKMSARRVPCPGSDVTWEAPTRKFNHSSGQPFSH